MESPDHPTGFTARTSLESDKQQLEQPETNVNDNVSQKGSQEATDNNSGRSPSKTRAEEDEVDVRELQQKYAELRKLPVTLPLSFG